MAYMVDPGTLRYTAAPAPKLPKLPAAPPLPPDPWAYNLLGTTAPKPPAAPGVPVDQADPWMNAVPGLVTYPSPTAPDTTPAAPASPTAPKYNLLTDPGVILAQHNAELARQAAARANLHAVSQISDQLAGRGLLGRAQAGVGEYGYRQGEQGYQYGQQLNSINNAPFAAFLAAWQYAQQHPEMYAGVTGLPAELGGTG